MKQSMRFGFSVGPYDGAPLIDEGTINKAFPLAEMSRDVRILTMICFAIPAGMGIGALLGARALLLPVLLIFPIYGWVWLLFRPTMFVIHPDSVEIIWPLKRRRIARESIMAVRMLDAKELKREVGWGMRVGAGGLWGGFGWLWTQRRGIVQMYLSRTDRLVWLERGSERSWLISPERPEEFIHELMASQKLPKCCVGVSQARLPALHSSSLRRTVRLIPRNPRLAPFLRDHHELAAR